MSNSYKFLCYLQIFISPRGMCFIFLTGKTFIFNGRHFIFFTTLGKPLFCKRLPKGVAVGVYNFLHQLLLVI